MLISNDREKKSNRIGIPTEQLGYPWISLNYSLSLLLIFTPWSPQDLVNTSHGAHSGARVWLKLEKYKNCWAEERRGEEDWLTCTNTGNAPLLLVQLKYPDPKLTREVKGGRGLLVVVGATLFPPLFNLKFYPSFCFLCDILDSLCSQLS